MNKDPEDNAYGVKFSEIHAIDLVDMDGDGIRDVVTGKRFWSHGRTGDPDRNDAAVLYWFRLSRGANGSVDFVPYLIDSESGVGTQVVAADLNGDSLPDVVVGNKRGTFVHLHGKKTVTREEWEQAQPKRYRVRRSRLGLFSAPPLTENRARGQRNRPVEVRRCRVSPFRSRRIRPRILSR